MAVRCAAITKGGTRCTSPVLADSTFCWTHDPAAADRRREASKKGGKARSNKARAAKQIPEAMTAEALAGWLSLLFTQVLTGRIEPKIGTACATIARTLHEVKHATELEERIAELEGRAPASYRVAALAGPSAAIKTARHSDTSHSVQAQIPRPFMSRADGSRGVAYDGFARRA